MRARLAAAGLLAVGSAAACAPRAPETSGRPSLESVPLPDATPDPRSGDFEAARTDPDLGRRAARLAAIAKDAAPSDRLARQARVLLVRTQAQRGLLDEMQRASGDLEIADDSEGADLLNVMAYAYAEAGTQLDRALAYSRRAVEVVQMLNRPETVPLDVWKRQIASVTAAYRDTLGWVLFKGGEVRGAVRELSQAAEVLPDDPTVNWHLGQAWIAAGRPKEALPALARAAVSDGEESSAAETLAYETAAKAGIPREEVAAQIKAARGALETRVREAALARKISEPAKDLAATRDPAGAGLQLLPGDGRPTVVLFWGAFSEPSVRALGRLRGAIDAGRVRFVAISLDRDGAAAESRARAAGLVGPVFLDVEGKDAEAFQIRGLPTLLVLDAQGRVRYRNEGIVPGYEIQLRAQLESLGEDPP